MNDEAVRTQAFDRTVRAWLDEGPSLAPGRALEAAFLEIETTPQARLAGPRLGGQFRVPWQLPATVAAALVVAAVGVSAFGPRGWLSSGNAFPTPAPSVTASPRATATPAPTVRAIGTRFGAGDIGPGEYRYVAFDPVFTFTVPGAVHLWVEPTSEESAPFSDSRDIHAGVDEGFDVLTAYLPWKDPCDPDAGRAVRTPRGVDDVIDWLRTFPSVEVSPSTAVSIGGMQATRVVVTATDACRARPTDFHGLAPRDRAFAMARSFVHHVYVVERPSGAVAIDVFAGGGSTREWLATADEIVASMRFEP